MQEKPLCAPGPPLGPVGPGRSSLLESARPGARWRYVRLKRKILPSSAVPHPSHYGVGCDFIKESAPFSCKMTSLLPDSGGGSHRPPPICIAVR